jgi:hypothetical protein
MPHKTLPYRDIEMNDPLREWSWIQKAIKRLRDCPGATLKGLPVTSLVRLTKDLGGDKEGVITPDLLAQTAIIAYNLGLFSGHMSEQEWLRRAAWRQNFRIGEDSPPTES